MPTACTLLPTLEEFDRLTAGQFQSVPITSMDYDTIMAMLDADTQTARMIKSPRGLALLALGLESKAWRAEECGSKRTIRCPEHHDQCEVQIRTCRSKTCSCCAPQLAEDRISRFWNNQPYMRNLKRFRIIRLHTPSQDTMPTREEIQVFNTAVSKWIKEIGDPRPGTGAISHVTIEMLGSEYKATTLLTHYRFRLEANILFWGEVSTSVLHDTTPFCIEHHLWEASELRETVKNLLTYHPPQSHEVCAQIELVTSGLRLIRTHGQMLKKDLLLDEDTLQLPDDTPVEEALVAEEGDTATNAHSSPSTSKKCCKKCGGPLSEVSGWISRYATPAEIANLQWTKVISLQPPG